MHPRRRTPMTADTTATPRRRTVRIIVARCAPPGAPFARAAAVLSIGFTRVNAEGAVWGRNDLCARAAVQPTPPHQRWRVTRVLLLRTVAEGSMAYTHYVGA